MIATRARLLAAVLVASAACSVAAAPSGVVHVTIVHTNDLHGHVENAAAVATLAREAKSRNPNTLFLDAGDAVSGTPVSTMFQGEAEFEAMSAMGCDAGLLGNHEFDFGWKRVARFRDLSKHPLLCANAQDPDGKPLGDEAFHVFAVGAVKVGVIGLLTEDMPKLASKEDWAGCAVEPPLAAAKRLVPEVRKQCDVLVLLTHVGVEVDAAIAGAVPGIDLVVGGHSHTELKQPLFVACGGKQVPIVQARSNGQLVGVVEFDWNAATKSVVGLTGRLVRVDRAKTSGADDVQRIVDRWLAKAGAAVDLAEVIGHADEKLPRETLRAALERIFAEATGADLGFQNLHGVRADVPAGDITVEHVWKALPFDETLVKVRLPGSRLPDDAKKRLGSSLDPKKEYVVATSSFVADQQRKYFGTDDAPVEKTGLALRDAVVAWVREHKGFDVAGARGGGDGDKR